MDDQTVIAAPSAAEESTTPSLDIPRSGSPEYAEWRTSGKLPDKTQPRTAEAATADPSKETISEANAENAGEPEPPKPTQEHNRRKPDAEQRIAQLVSENKRYREELEAIRTPKSVAEAPRQAQPTQQQPQAAQAEPTPEDKNQDGTARFDTYEKYVKALARWEVEQELAQRQQQWAAQAQEKELKAKVADAQARYGDAFNASRDAFTKATLGPQGEPLIPVGILSMVSDSDILTDLVHRIGSNPEDLVKFVQVARTNPRAAILHIAEVENAIKAEMAQGASDNRNDKGQFVARAKPEPPAKRGPESAPEPPLEIGSRGSGPMDDSARALKTIENGDVNGKATRAWLEAENAKYARRLRGN